MKSPFPGMDPYLERYWLGVHGLLIAQAAVQLNQVLPDQLVATIEERVAIGADDDEMLRYYAPDIRVNTPDDNLVDSAMEDGAVITAPYRLVSVIDPVRERFIQIIEPGTEFFFLVIAVPSASTLFPAGMH